MGWKIHPELASDGKSREIVGWAVLRIAHPKDMLIAPCAGANLTGICWDIGYKIWKGMGGP